MASASISRSKVSWPRPRPEVAGAGRLVASGPVRRHSHLHSRHSPHSRHSLHSLHSRHSCRGSRLEVWKLSSSDEGLKKVASE